MDAFYSGYNMQDYAFAEECWDSSRDFMDQLHEFHLNMTRRFDFSDPYFLIFSITGNEFNDSWFYCYQFTTDIIDEYKQKAESFVDFGDVYMSFLFNLLANSLYIRTASTAIAEASDL